MATERRRWRVVGSPAAKGPYTELADVARALEVQYAGAVQLEVRIDGAPVVISLDLNSGTVCGLIITVALEGMPRWPSSPVIELRRERAVDVEGKERGINREVQLGDAHFDRTVYIDSDATDDEVTRLLARPQTRAAVLALVNGQCTSVSISRSTVTGKWGAAPGYQRGHVLPALEALLAIAGGGGPRVPGAPRRGVLLLNVAAVCLLLTPAYFGVALSVWTTEWRLPALGATLGLVAAFFARPLIARLMAGDSASFGRYRVTVFLAFVDLAFGGAGLALHLNGALDTSKPVVVEGRITHLGSYDSENDTTSVTITWSDGSQGSQSFASPTLGEGVTQARHAGALGQRWVESVWRTGRR